METGKMEHFYQKAANILIDMIPEDWDKVLLYAEIREGYSQIYFYYYPSHQHNGNRPVYSLDIMDIFEIDINYHRDRKRELYECFEELWNEFKIQGQEQWSNLTYILESTGRMNIQYGYEDISQMNPVEKQEQWEAKYL